MAKIFSSAVQTTVVTPNLSNFSIDVIIVTAAGTPVQLPDKAIPDGVDIVIRAYPGNRRAKIYLANSAANCADATKRTELVAGEAIGLSLTNSNLVYIDSDTNGSKIELVVEQ